LGEDKTLNMTTESFKKEDVPDPSQGKGEKIARVWGEVDLYWPGEVRKKGKEEKRKFIRGQKRG